MGRPRSEPATWGALAFTGSYAAAAAVGVVVTGNREFMVYLAVLLTSAAVLLALHRRIGFSPALVWALSVLGALHMAGGLVRPPEGWAVDGKRVLYNLWLVPRWVKFDQLVHVCGAAVGTWVCWQGLRSAVELRRPGTGPVALCVFAGMGLGALNETAEFLTTRIVSDTNVGGFENTGWDLVSNLIGATVAGFAIRAAGVGGSITPKTFS